ncbi:MAG TPA: hypothetical protein VEL10_00145 [Gaiellaceae bacterium]|nr:hypothetical protein [Gaiellaceae bacterium]
METTEQHLDTRRAFLLKGAAVGAGAIGAGRLLADPPAAHASGGLTPGDAAILQFLAAAEILETDAWQQYNELGGIQDSEVPAEAGIWPTPRRLRCWTKTWTSTSTTTPTTSSPTSPSSTLI